MFELTSILTDTRKYVYDFLSDALPDMFQITVRGRGLTFDDTVPDGGGRVFDLDLMATAPDGCKSGVRFLASEPATAPPGSAQPVADFLVPGNDTDLTRLFDLTDALLDSRDQGGSGQAYFWGTDVTEIKAGRGADVLFSSAADRFHSVNGFAGDDVIFSADDALLRGGAGDDFIYAPGGATRSYGGKGDDVVIVASGSVMRGGSGNDTLINMGGGNMQIFAGPGDNVIHSRGEGLNSVRSGHGTLVLDAGLEAMSKFNDFDAGLDRLWLRGADGGSMTSSDAFDLFTSNAKARADGWRFNFEGHVIIIDIDTLSDLTADNFLGTDTAVPTLDFGDRISDIEVAGLALESEVQDVFGFS